jgi:predicted ATPase
MGYGACSKSSTSREGSFTAQTKMCSATSSTGQKLKISPMEKQLKDLLKQQLPQELSLKAALDDLKHIELTDEETDRVILEAKLRKANELEWQEKQKRIAQQRELLTGKTWDFQQTDGFMKYRASKLFNGKFSWDESNTAVYQLLCYYFSADPQFVSVAKAMGVDDPSLDKGNLLMGNFGTGKTWMMKLFTKNSRQVFGVHNAKIIAERFHADGDEGIEQYEFPAKNPVDDPDCFYQRFMGLCIDDLGTEEIKNHYGNRKNVVGDLLEKRYAKGNYGILLHATTNLTGDQLTGFYGGRVGSRMCEMFNFIELPGKDKRG